MFEVVMLDIKKASAIFKNHASSVVLPGEEGEMTVLDFHQSIVSTLKRGIIKIDNLNVHIEGGIAGVMDNKLTILIERL